MQPKWSLTLSFSLSPALLLAGALVGCRGGGGIPGPPPGVDVIERGPDFAVYQQVTSVVGPDGQTRFRTNRFTLLENGLHYLEAGGWKESRDLIEPSGEGAVARYGPNQATFSLDLNAAAVFDIQLANGSKLRGGVREIRVTDRATDRSAVLGSARASAPGELIPPNQIRYRDAFEGIDADVVLVWEHDLFRQDVVIRERPVLPAGWDPATARLEVLTGLVECPDPEVRRQTVVREGEAPLEDDVVLGFGGLDMLKGHAFAVAGEPAWAFGGLTAPPGATPVLKHYQERPDGRRFVVESVAWRDAEAAWQGLPRTAAREPAESVDGSDEPAGYVVDFVMVHRATKTTLTASETYYIQRRYASGSPLTLQPGCTIKFNHDAHLLVYGPVSFPGAGAEVVFTSRNDDLFGAVIQKVPGEEDSDGNPTMYQASAAVRMYHVGSGTTVQNARILWARKGIEYDGSPGVEVTHHLSDSRFAYCEAGVYANSPSATLVFTDVTKCSLFGPPLVCSPTGGCGTVSGAMATAPECEVESVAWVNDPSQDTAAGDPHGDPNKNTQSECSFVLAADNRVVVAFWDTHLSACALGEWTRHFTGRGPIRSTGWAVSNDNGVSFTDQGPLLPTPPGSAWEGDAGDTVMARNPANGHIYLLLNPSREHDPGMNTWFGFRLWKSIDNGHSFSLLNTDIFGGHVTLGDKPMIATSSAGTIYAAGRGTLDGTNGVIVASSSDGGSNWSDPDLLGTFSGADIAIGSSGDVYVFFLHAESGKHTLQYRWLRSGTWKPGPEDPIPTIPAHAARQHLFSTLRSGGGNSKRSNSADDEDYFVSNAFPRAVVNPVTGRIYVVFADLPEADAEPPNPRGTDRGDIFVQEATVNADGSLTWLGGAVRANQDATETDQWNASIAVSPDGKTLFIGYYSRQDRPAENDLFRAYGVKADISSGLANATFDTFPISPTLFPPLFPGPVAVTPPCNTWLYDPVFPQADVCVDADARVVPCPAPDGAPPEECGEDERRILWDGITQRFMADDYTWAAADDDYFYFGWCDRSRSCSLTGGTRPDPNVRFARIRH